jgi:hypothetical protein
MIWMLAQNTHPAALGLLPDFLSEDDPRPAAKQFDERYRHGGWRPLPGFAMSGNELLYPGDPPQPPIALVILRGEVILLYDYDFVAIVQPDGSFEVSRLD